MVGGTTNRIASDIAHQAGVSGANVAVLNHRLMVLSPQMISAFPKIEEGRNHELQEPLTDRSKSEIQLERELHDSWV